MSEDLQISAIVPVRNGASTLPPLLSGLQAQTLGRDRYEVIVVDNASTDQTQAVIASYGDARIRAFRNEHNLGLFGNFSRCLELAEADLVKFVCSDDWLDPSYLERAIPVMESNPEVALLTTAGLDLGTA